MLPFFPSFKGRTLCYSLGCRAWSSKPSFQHLSWNCWFFSQTPGTIIADQDVMSQASSWPSSAKL